MAAVVTMRPGRERGLCASARPADAMPSGGSLFVKGLCIAGAGLPLLYGV